MQKEDRAWQAMKYRFGFNGKEMVNELAATGFAIADQAVCKFNWMTTNPVGSAGATLCELAFSRTLERLTAFGICFAIGGFTSRIVGGFRTFRPRNLGVKRILNGKFQVVNELMSDAAKSYQYFVAGKAWNNNKVLAGVKFDGYINGISLDEKSGLKFAVGKDGAFRSWFTGKESLLNQARRQIRAAEGNRIRWTFENEEVVNATRLLFEENNIAEIELMFVPI